MGYVVLRQTNPLERMMQVRPFGCFFRFSSGVSGMTTLSSSARQTSPGDNRSVDAPATLSAERRSIRYYSPVFSRRGRQSSRVRRWLSSLSLSSPRTERSTGSSRSSSSRVRGRVFGTVAMSDLVLSFLGICDTSL